MIYLVINLLWIIALFVVGFFTLEFLYYRLEVLYNQGSPDLEELNEEIKEYNEMSEGIHNIQSMVLGGEFDEQDSDTDS